VERWSVEASKRAGCAVTQQSSKLHLRLPEHPLGDGAAGGYANAAAELGMTSNTVAVSVHRLSRHYRQFVREEISRTGRPQ
jgi:hypothetical protein